MFAMGQIIDGKYRVDSVCSDEGGMGTILHVTPTKATYPYAVVLKYCKAPDEESRLRFVREVRYLADHRGNTRFVEVLDHNLAHTPAYFVMKYFTDGDLLTFMPGLMTDANGQENLFGKICDCIGELHSKGLTHRDIKPQNFLRDGINVIVSDFGLAKAAGVGTTFTVSNAFWGTQGYVPPEFLHGEFKKASPASDIFMLGKTFYHLLSGRDTTYLSADDIHPALFHVIERCCSVKANDRYDSIDSLKQDLKLAFDVILMRADGLGKARQMLAEITTRLDAENKYDSKQVMTFLDAVAKLQPEDKNSIFVDLDRKFYIVLSQAACDSRLEKFFSDYEPYVRTAVGSWSYAETVANNMAMIFERSTNVKHQARALEIAIEAASWANRFAAMGTCTTLITKTPDGPLGLAVAALITKHRDSFLASIDTSTCASDAVRNAIRSLRPAPEPS